MRGMITGANPLAGMTQEDIVRLLTMLQAQQQQPQPMLTGPMMLAGSGVSAQTEAELRRLGVHPSQIDRAAPAAPMPATYSVGSAAPGQVSLEQRQRNASAAKLGLPPGKDYTDDEIRAAYLRQRPAPR